MDQYYKPMYQRAHDLLYKFHDYLGQGPYDPRAEVLKHEIRELVEDVEKQKNPRSIENRVKIIQRELQTARRHENPYMHYDHLDDLHHHYESIRQDLHHFDNY